MSTPQASILVIEDDASLGQTFREILEGEDYEVSLAATAAEARASVEQRTPDLILTDLVLPDADGLILCADLKAKLGVPVIVVSGTVRKRDSILALKLGADDFIPKPFDVDELLTRIESALKRARAELGVPAAVPLHAAIARRGVGVSAGAAFQSPAPVALEPASSIGPLTLERARKRVTFNNRDVPLTPTEYRLLAALMTRPDEVLSRRDLAQLMWGYEDASNGRSIDVHVHRLRAKLQRAQEGGGVPGPTIISVRGFGYKLLADPSVSAVAAA